MRPPGSPFPSPPWCTSQADVRLVLHTFIFPPQMKTESMFGNPFPVTRLYDNFKLSQENWLLLIGTLPSQIRGWLTYLLLFLIYVCQTSQISPLYVLCIYAEIRDIVSNIYLLFKLLRCETAFMPVLLGLRDLTYVSQCNKMFWHTCWML